MNGNQNYNDKLPQTGREDQHQKDLLGIYTAEGIGKTELSLILYWDVNAYNEIQPVHPKGDQSWVFIGRTDAEAETPVLWPPHVKS